MCPSSLESASSRLSLPPCNDPVILKAVETSIVRSRASSIHSAALINQTNKQRHPFRRWMAALQRRSSWKGKEVRPREERWSLDEFDDDDETQTKSQQVPRWKLKHRKSMSWRSGASSALVAGTRSALLSLSTLSETPSSRHSHKSKPFLGNSRSERQSLSLDLVDDASKERAIKRCQTLDEIVDSEEDYILGLKALLNVSWMPLYWQWSSYLTWIDWGSTKLMGRYTVPCMSLSPKLQRSTCCRCKTLYGIS